MGLSAGSGGLIRGRRPYMQLKKWQVRRPTRSKQFTRKNEENVFFVHLCGRGLIWGGGGGLIGGEIRYQANDIIALHSPHGTYQVGV